MEPPHEPDPPAIDCELARELVSADADDELRAGERSVLSGHLAGCAACRAHAEQVALLTRHVRVRRLGGSAASTPDLVERVLARSRPARLGRGGWLRPALAWCGLVIAAQSMRPLVWGDLSGTPTHVARHVGASALALAIGFLYAAWRPHRAFGLLPLVGALLATTLFGAVLDTAGGNRNAFAELVHVAELVGAALLWMVAGSPGWDRLSEHRPARRPHGGRSGPAPSTR